MNVAIVGSKGIPASYGGFETLAEYLSIYLVNTGHSVTVYCSGGLRKAEYKGVDLIHLPLAANRFQGIIYDFVSLLLSVKSHDKIIMLGSPAGPLLRLIPSLKSKLVFNYGGLDFERSKWTNNIQNFIKYGKKMAVQSASVVIADNQGIFDYISNSYMHSVKNLVLIEYGGNHAEVESKVKMDLRLPQNYSLTIARIQKDNNIELIIQAAVKYGFNAVIIGNWDFDSYGKTIRSKYVEHENLFLLDPIYDIDSLYNYRKSCRFYIHGHSAGGTNPTLVEAMWLGLDILSFDNVFNRHTTENQASYWSTEDELGSHIQDRIDNGKSNNAAKMKNIANVRYTWDIVCKKYLEAMER